MYDIGSIYLTNVYFENITLFDYSILFNLTGV